MAASTIEVLLKFTGDPRNAKDAIAQVRADLTKSTQEQVTSARNVNRQVATEAKNQTRTLEKEERDRVRAAESLQRQRSVALIAAWKTELREKQRIEKEKEKAEKGGGADFTLLLNNVPVLRGITSQFSSLTTEAAGAATAMGGVAAGIGIVVAGAAVAIGVLVKLGAEIFDLTKKTAEFQGKFFDLSQQVGVSVETLSALDVIASTTGGNIDTVTGSLALFQRNLQDAHDPTSKEAKLLKELGVTTLDTETAFRQALKGLFAFGEGSKQTDAVLQLFGRSGRFVNAIMKESKGNFDEAAKAIEGLQVSRAAAAAADQFNDSLNILNRTISRVGANIVSNAIPAFTVFFQDLNRALTGNENDWSEWAKFIEIEVAGVLGTLQGLADFILSGGALDPLAAIDARIDSILRRAAMARAGLAAEAAIDQLQRAVAAGQAGRPGDRPDAGKANSEAQQRAAKLIQLQQKALEESTRNAERERDKDIRNIDEWENETILALTSRMDAQFKIYNDELANARQFIKNKADLRLAEIEIELKRNKAVTDTLAAIDKTKEDAQKKRDQAEIALNTQLVKIRDAQRDEELRQIKSDVDARVITESEGLRRQLELVTQAHNDRAILRALELEDESASLERKQQLDADKIESEIRYTTEFKRLTEERMAAMAREAAAQQPVPGGPVTIPSQIPINIGPPPEISIWTEAMGALQQKMEEFSKFVRGTFIESLLGISDALAQGVATWAMYGGSFAKAMKQSLVALGAKVSAEAIMQAALHAAYAIGSLAFGDFGAAAKHAIAAAKFAAIGGVAAIATRALAGNDFKQGEGGGAFASGSTSGGRSGVAVRTPLPVEQDRRTLNQQAITLNVNVKRDAGSIVEVVVDDHRNNGPIRQMVLSER